MMERSVALDRFELLELRRDDGVQTFHARELSTARPVQVHFLSAGAVPENLALLSQINRLPDAERRRVIDRGISEGRPYIVTDRLAGFASLREWLGSKCTQLSIDQQFLNLFDNPLPATRGIEAREEDDDNDLRDRLPFGALALGIAVAIVFLALVIGIVAFHPSLK